MAESLRDQLEASFNEVIPAETPAEPAPPAEVTPPATSETADPKPAEATPSEPEKPGRTAGRPRDSQGRLLPGPAVRPEMPAPAPIQAQPQAKHAHPRPSSWKKDYWGFWDQLDPKLAEYINQREGEFAKGVSTYKTEYETVKPLADALQPFMPILQQNGIKPDQWITNLGNAHRQLVYGSPEQKLGMFLKLAQDYQVNLQSLFVRGQDGQVYYNPQIQAPAQQPQAQPQVDVAKLVDERISAIQSQKEIDSFMRDERYPHAQEVRETMAGILQAGLADDLPQAYDAALRHPKHFHLFEAQQKQQREADEKKKREEAQAAAARARANAVSPRTATPTAPTGATAGKKGLRDQLSENFDAVVGGRV